MNKFSLYIILILLYVSLAKSFSPSEFGINYVHNEISLGSLIKDAPVSAILIDTHETGFLIKTYYHKYRIVYGFKNFDELIVRVSKSYFDKHKASIGMEIFRRFENLSEDYLTLPPGALFVGDKYFGLLKKDPKLGKKWDFHKVYQNIPEALGWGTWRPDENFIEELQRSASKDEIFYGLNKEFGPQGYITIKNFPNYFMKKNNQKQSLNSFYKKYLNQNYVGKRHTHE